MHADAQLNHAEQLLSRQAKLEEKFRLHQEQHTSIQSARTRANRKQSADAQARKKHADDVQERLRQGLLEKEKQDSCRHGAKSRFLSQIKDSERVDRESACGIRDNRICQAQAKSSEQDRRRRGDIAERQASKERRNQEMRQANEDARQRGVDVQRKQRLEREERVAHCQQLQREMQEMKDATFKSKIERTAAKQRLKDKVHEEHRRLRIAMEQKSAELKELTERYLASGGDARIQGKIRRVRQNLVEMVEEEASFQLLQFSVDDTSLSSPAVFAPAPRAGHQSARSLSSPTGKVLQWIKSDSPSSTIAPSSACSTLASNASSSKSP